MAKSIDVSDLNIYYGDFLAVEGVNMTIKSQVGHRVHRTLRAAASPPSCASLNRMHEVIPGARVEGKVVVDGQSLYDPSVDPVAVRRQIGMVFQRPNPFPTMSIYENVLAGNRLNAKRHEEVRGRRDRREVADAREPLERGQGPARTSPAWGSPAVSSSGCASPARSR